MFTIEHEFDATVITLIDEAPAGELPLAHDVTILTFDDRVVIEQADADGAVARVTLSLLQVEELRAALNLPEGSYRLDR
ncbi:hypothetical protein [Paracoccus luteus]|uniref:hypothetical protein n=1 Tax=Paracoccus luteus TaxID=2508543 RepID=UPI00106FC935|nr:hypothetical protein [Paracoccus luteus]